MIKEKVSQVIERALQACVADGLLPAGDHPAQLDAPKQASHGDFACNAAMVLAKQHAAATGAAKPNPRALAEAIRARVLDAKVAADPAGILSSIEIAGPGFLNLKLAPAAWHAELLEIGKLGNKFGRSNAGQGAKTMVEFVSANPTGPMHVGHGRGAVIGDTVASLLDWAGFAVQREFYVNDAGAQVFRLAHAVLARATEIAVAERIEGCPDAAQVPLDPEDYQGDYVKEISRAWVNSIAVSERLQKLAQPFEEQKEPLRKFSTDWVLQNLIQEDLKLFNITFDRYFSEKTLHDANAIAAAVEELRKQGVLSEEVLEKPADAKKAEKTAKNTAAHESAKAALVAAGSAAAVTQEIKKEEAEVWAPNADPATPAPVGHDDEKELIGKKLLVMKTTRFGDDRDRPLFKTSGEPTYFAADVAYHWNKIERGYKRMINVWGADHGGYVQRMKAAVQSMGGQLEVILFQLVNLMKDGKPFKMSKRAANFVTLRELIEEAGADATRFFFLLRRGDMALDFDLDLAKKRSSDNPVFYVQYGHARCAGILAKATESPSGAAALSIAKSLDQVSLLNKLVLPEELQIIQRLLTFPEVVAGAAAALEPHRIVFYLQETIAQFHSYYSKYKKTERVVSDDVEKSAARLYLVMQVKQVLFNALALLGVSAPERMESDRAAVEEDETEPANA
jgi:arginyl-tRNA synthetase